MINTDDKEFYDLLLMLRSHGWLKDLDQETYDKKIEESGVDSFHRPFTFFVPGFNVRSTDLQAYIGLRQMKKIHFFAKKRNENHLRYAKNLEGYVEFQDWGNNFPVSISFGALARNSEHRKEIVERLIINGIETRLLSAGNLGRHKFWKDIFGEFRHPVSDKIHDCGFFIPNNQLLKDVDIDFISAVVKNDPESL